MGRTLVIACGAWLLCACGGTQDAGTEVPPEPGSRLGDSVREPPGMSPEGADPLGRLPDGTYPGVTPPPEEPEPPISSSPPIPPR
jgi:hypothetical protein